MHCDTQGALKIKRMTKKSNNTVGKLHHFKTCYTIVNAMMTSNYFARQSNFPETLQVTSAKKMMTFENAVFKVRFKNFFSSHKIQVPFLRYLIFCILNHSTNFGNCPF